MYTRFSPSLSLLSRYTERVSSRDHPFPPSSLSSFPPPSLSFSIPLRETAEYSNLVVERAINARELGRASSRSSRWKIREHRDPSSFVVVVAVVVVVVVPDATESRKFRVTGLIPFPHSQCQVLEINTRGLIRGAGTTRDLRALRGYIVRSIAARAVTDCKIRFIRAAQQYTPAR